jgi:hypothetical protein
LLSIGDVATRLFGFKNDQICILQIQQELQHCHGFLPSFGPRCDEIVPLQHSLLDMLQCQRFWVFQDYEIFQAGYSSPLLSQLIAHLLLKKDLVVSVRFLVVRKRRRMELSHAR